MSSARARPTVVILAKAPILGTVKTRLARTIGEDEALAIYRQLLHRTVEMLTAPGWDLLLAVTPDETAADDRLWPPGPKRIPQGSGDLGERMLRPLARAGVRAPAVVIGSDIPAIEPVHIASAFRVLETKSFVFGPALDGGFYLAGTANPPPATIFAGVEWSCATTLDQVLDRLPEAAFGLVDPLDDLDDAASLSRHRAAGRLSSPTKLTAR